MLGQVAGRTKFIALFVVAAIALLGVGWLAAENHAAAVEARSALLASAAERLSDDGAYAEAMLMATQADPASQGDLVAALLRPDGFAPARDALTRAFSHNLVQQVFIGHDGGVRSAALSPDGRLVVTGGEDGTARLWSADTGVQLSLLSSQGGIVNAVAFAPDGKSVLAGGASAEVKQISVPDGREIASFRDGDVVSLAFSPDGKTVMTSGSSGIRLWPAGGGDPVQVSINGTMSAEFTPDGRFVVGAMNYGGKVHMWPLTGGEPVATWNPDNGAVRDLAVAPLPARDRERSGEYQMLTGDSHGSVQDWYLARPERRSIVGLDLGEIMSVAYSPDGEARLFSAEDGVVRWANGYAQPHLRPAFTGHDGLVYSIAFSRDGKRVLTASGDGTARLWEVPRNPYRISTSDSAALWRVSVAGPGNPDDVPAALAVSPDSKTFLAGTYDGQVTLRSTSDGHLLQTFSMGQRRVTRVAFAPGGESVLAATGAEVRQWPLTGGEPIRIVPQPGLAALSADGTTVLAGARMGFRPALEESETAPLTGVAPLGAVAFAALSADGGMAAVAEVKDGVSVWTSAGGKPSAHIKAPGLTQMLAFSPDGKLLATGGSYGEDVHVWRVTGGPPVASFKDRQIVALAFTPDGKYLLTGGGSMTARLWPVAGGPALASFPAYGVPPYVSRVSSAAITPDGRTVLVGASWGFIEAWPLNPLPGPAREQVKATCTKLANIGLTQFTTADYLRFPNLKRDAKHPCAQVWAGK